MGTQLPSPKRGHGPPIFGPSLLCPNGCMHQDAIRYGGRPQPRRLRVRCGPSPLPEKGAEPLFSAHIYCGQTAGWIKMPLGTEVGLGPDDIMLHGDPALPPKKRHSRPNFRPMCIVTKLLYVSGIRIPLATEIGLSLGNIVSPHCSSPLKGHSLQFSANVRCGQTPGWIDMPLVTEVGLGPGDFVFDKAPANPEKNAPTPT